jgi:hypothetical protein
MAVRVAVIPGSGVGITKAVLVGVGRMRVGALDVVTDPDAEDETDWARIASLLDIKPVKAT